MGGRRQFSDRTCKSARKQESQQQSYGNDANRTDRINLLDAVQEIRLSRVHIYGRLPGHQGPHDLSIYFYGDAIL